MFKFPQLRLGIISILSLPLITSLEQDFDCTFSDIYPLQYASPKLQSHQSIELDGKLDDDAWQQVEFSDYFIDIENEVIPRLNTQMKIRWDDDYIYVGAILTEPQPWANYTEDDMIIFHDNDIEVFLDPNGCNCYYKEFEMNALNKTWMLSLNKPYSVGGNENSTRLYPDNGWTMKPLLQCATFVEGEANNPRARSLYWSVEIRLPIDDILVNQSYSHPANGTRFWRINFSRVQYHVIVKNYVYKKIIADDVHEDNWVWSPQGVINMHVPNRWGILQFCERVGSSSCELQYYDEWPIRQMAMSVFNAEYAYLRETNDPLQGSGTNFTANWTILQRYSSVPFDGTCLIRPPEIELIYEGNDTSVEAIGYVITVENEEFVAMVNQEQYLVVIDKRNRTDTTLSPKKEDDAMFGTWERILLSLGIVGVFFCLVCTIGVVYWRKKRGYKEVTEQRQLL